MEGLINKMKAIHKTPTRVLFPASGSNPPSSLGSHSTSGGDASLLLNKRFTLPFLALLAALAVGLLFLMPGGLLHAQDAETIMYSENRMDPVATYTATDPEGAMIMWSLAGDDADDFMIENGVLSFKESPDFETAMGGSAGTSNTYVVIVKATDETRNEGMETVMVKVTNVDEAGKVALSALRPQSDTAFTAMISDPDGNVADEKWQWAKASSRNGSYRNIATATSETYEPTDADSGSYLRATVTYEDAEGEGKSAMMKSDFPSQRIRGSNNAPEFADDQDPTMDEDQEDAERSVAENTEAGKTVGSPVVATDDDNDTLTYTLTGDDAEHFGINWATGQILTKTKLDHENGDSSLTDRDNTTEGLQLEVMVRATDPAGIPGADNPETENSDTVTVNITVTDKNEAPVVTGDAEVTFNEVDGNIATVLGTYTATDPDAAAPDPTWTVGGADRSKFTAEGGALMFKAKPNYEMPTDTNKDNVYEVTVQASDARLTGMTAVKVMVGNEEEAGVVTLSQVQPRVGFAVKASLTDPDGSISKLTWQWSISDGAVTTAGDITGATSDTYKPVADDIGGTLTAKAMYFDGHSDATADATDKEAMVTADNAVKADITNAAPVFGDEDPDMDGVQNSMATRNVEENTEGDVGHAVTATDAGDDGITGNTDDETPQYTLGGPDAAMFKVGDLGQIMVGDGTDLDYETKSTYMVTLTATDSFSLSSSIAVTIMVTDVDEMPDVTGDKMRDYRENRMDPVATYTATDPEGAMIMWSLAGDDADDFMIENGVLSFKESPDFETAMGGSAGTSNTYVVIVKATDETRNEGMETVMVKVTNVDEAGKVALSALRPQSDTAFTAMISDPDGNVADEKWQWAKASSRNGSYRNIATATSETYEPTDADSGSYLRATVTYEDAEGEGKSAMMKSDFPSQQIRGSNNAPEFADDQDPTMDEDQEDAERSVAENTEAGKTVGSPVVATDDDNDTLTYTLTGDDAEHFGINWATGQILTKTKLDHENGDSSLTDRDNTTEGLQLEVMVRATDPAGIPGADNPETENSDTVTVNITVTDKNEAPVVTGDAEVTFNEVDGNIATVLGTYTATDPDAAAPDPTWTVGGADRSKFTAEGGALMFKAKPNYEMPTDTNKDNVYEVTVQASDARLTGMTAVKVMVGNEEEAGVVTLSQVQPRVGFAVKASLTDPDGSISKLTWQWSISDGAVTTAGDITGATSDTYKPVADDIGGTLTAKAMYFDGHSDATADATDKEAMVTADNAVKADITNAAPVFGDEDPDMDGVQNSMATRNVEENTEGDVGHAVTATDAGDDGITGNTDDETPQYTLGGPDAAMFKVGDLGQIMVGDGTDLDYETKSTYMVTLTATDSFSLSSSIAVTIMVTDVDEMPKIMVGGLAISGMSSPSYPENGMDAVETYMAAGPNAASARWSLEGDDADDFRISSGGMLTFKSSPDYENPMDADTDNEYMVTVKANDGTYMDTHNVTVTVTNVDEDGTVMLSSMTPVVGVELTATVTDLDGGITGETWQWASSDDMDSAFTNIPGAMSMSASYTPVAADNGMFLRATVSYTDGHSSGKTEMATTANMVTMNASPMFSSGTATREVAENTAAGMDIGAPVTATDADDDTLTYALGGADAASFDIGSATGQLMTKAALDYEMPRGAEMSDTNTNDYMVTVTATDPEGASDMITVTITVTDVDEEMTLLQRYDANKNGMIDKPEVVEAINDYLDGVGDVSKADVIAVINLYLG